MHRLIRTRSRSALLKLGAAGAVVFLGSAACGNQSEGSEDAASTTGTVTAAGSGGTSTGVLGTSANTNAAQSSNAGGGTSDSGASNGNTSGGSAGLGGSGGSGGNTSGSGGLGGATSTGAAGGAGALGERCSVTGCPEGYYCSSEASASCMADCTCSSTVTMGCVPLPAECGDQPSCDCLPTTCPGFGQFVVCSDNDGRLTHLCLAQCFCC